MRDIPSQSQVAEDTRWPAVRDALGALAGARRRSLRLVDVACGEGTLLLRAARYARALGFTAIEARGIDRCAATIARARRRAAALTDPAIGLRFEVGAAGAALAQEAAFPADLLLWPGAGRSEPGLAGAARRAGRCVIALAEARGGGRIAA